MNARKVTGGSRPGRLPRRLRILDARSLDVAQDSSCLLVGCCSNESINVIEEAVNRL